jgi:hypothetical protein
VGDVAFPRDVYCSLFLAIQAVTARPVVASSHTEGREEPDVPFRLRPIGVAAGLFILMLYLTFASAATYDYLDWNCVRWKTDLDLAERRTIPAIDIDGGWEYNNYIANLARLDMSHQERELTMAPEEKESGMWGRSLDRPYPVSSQLATGYCFESAGNGMTAVSS